MKIRAIIAVIVTLAALSADIKQKTSGDFALGGLNKIASGTTLAEAIKYKPKTKAQAKLIDDRKTEMLNKMTSIQITNEIQQSNLNRTQRDDLLRRLPDRKGSGNQDVKNPDVYAPTGDILKPRE